jgi:hypothetical protein
MEIASFLKSLAQKRPVFHSEKDFQLHFAWEMKEHNYDVRLEYDPRCFDANAAIDIMLPKDQIAIELKYKSRLFVHEYNGEAYALKNHAAEDVARYDFWKDVWRLETVVRTGKARCGYAIFVTNNPGYWKPGRRTSVDAAFRMHDGREVYGQLAWNGASEGTMKHRESPIQLGSSYTLRWINFSELNVRGGMFQYLLLEIK